MPDDLTAGTLQLLRGISTATVTYLLSSRGFRRASILGVRPIVPGTKMVGEAFTLRYLPAREDLDWNGSTDNLTDPQRIAIEQVGPGHVFVMDARGEIDAGSLGAILATRLKVRGSAGVVTDGAVRDYVEIGATGLPTYCRAAHPAANKAIHHPQDFGLPIGCGGVAVFPGDVVIGDDDGVVVIPRHLAGEVAERGAEMELEEEFIMQRVRDGASIVGTYPLDQAGLAEYSRWRSARDGRGAR
jgi:regulator of RNase E activity RraA